jgi:threonine dehydrogenase-like Zn-dependent dehydrogenase
VETVPDPHIINPRDAVIKITSTAICGSDLHFYDGLIPALKPGDIVGHEFMGEIVDLGPGARGSHLNLGDRVVVPFAIACGQCYFCEHELWSLCDNSNPNAAICEAMYGYSGSGLFGYTQIYGGYAGGQAEYARVPYADTNLFHAPAHLSDEQVLFLTDIFPTGYMAVENGNIQPGDTVAIWGCGPVGQFTIHSAWMFGAGRVIAIDRIPERLRLAETWGRAETLNYEAIHDVVEALKQMTGGRGPDVCIDAVGMEAHGTGISYAYDRVTQALKLQTDRPTALREVIQACRKGGTVSIPGVYGGFPNMLPFGAAFGKGLTLRMGQTHVHKYIPPLMERITQGEIQPSMLITHRLPLENAPHGYEIFKRKEDGCIKVVLKPDTPAHSAVQREPAATPAYAEMETA